MKNYLNILRAIIVTTKNWPEVVLKKITKSHLEVIKLRDGTLFGIRGILGNADLSMLSEIWFYHYYNPKGFEIKETDTVFDIGANNGFFSIYAAKKTTKGNVFAFEPVPSLSQKIKDNCALNKLGNITVEQVAVSKENGVRTLFVSGEHNGCHSLYERSGTSSGITVQTVNLKEYCVAKSINTIDLLKIDCEGAEYEILSSIDEVFARRVIKKVVMEYHDNIVEGKTHEEIHTTFERWGFEVIESAGYLYARTKNI